MTEAGQSLLDAKTDDKTKALAAKEVGLRGLQATVR